MKLQRPPFNFFPILKNHRIILRDVQEADLQHLVEISFYEGIPAKDLNDAQIMNERIRADYLNGNSVHWIISSILSGEILGTCGFYRGFQDGIGEIGYVLIKTHQGQGYMGEAVSLMLCFGWKELRLKQIRGVTSQDNPSSISVLKKAGFKLLEAKDNEMCFHILSTEIKGS